MIWIYYILLVFLTVTSVPSFAIDTDTFTELEWAEPSPGQEIRLLAIYPANLPVMLPKDHYRYLVSKQNSTTRYGALLAHIFMKDGVWLQNQLVKEGQAIVMPVYESDENRLILLKNTEIEARRNGRGLWASGPGFLYCAAAARKAFDSFAIIQGRLMDATRVRGTIYLNFGVDWHTDFTVKIEVQTFRVLPEEVQKTLEQLTEDDKPDIVIEARGWVFYEGGPMIEIKKAAQLDFLKLTSPFIKGGCLI